MDIVSIDGYFVCVSLMFYRCHTHLINEVILAKFVATFCSAEFNIPYIKWISSCFGAIGVNARFFKKHLLHKL